MNQNQMFQNVISGLLLVAVVTFSMIGINALDHLRFSIEEINRTLAALPHQAVTTGDSSGAKTGSIPGTSQRSSVPDSPMANSEFYAKDAVSGGRIIQATGTDTKNMNYVVNNDSAISQLWSMATDSLAERNDKNIGEYQPQLAESWTLSEDKMSYRIRLRKGILWHDFVDPVTKKEWKNVEVTAHDFKFYVDVIKNEDVDAAPMRGYLQALKEIKIINDYEFDVVWSEKYFLSMEITLSLIPLPRHLYHAYDGPFNGKLFNDDHARNRMIVGCGPYRFVRWDKGSRIVMKRFDNYYGARYGTLPPIETLVYELIQHPNTRLLSLISQDIDMDTLTPDQWINRAKEKAFQESDGWLRRISYPAFSYNYIGLNQKNSLFGDRKVRVALSHLIDRERILKDVYFNLAKPVSGPFGANDFANDASIKPYTFSPETARKLLAEAGWKDENKDGILEKDGKNLSFTIMYPNVNTTYQKMLPIIKEDMAKAGVNVELLGLEWAVVVERLEKKKYEACALGWTTTINPDPYQLWHSSGADVDSSSNHIGFSNSEADRLISEIRVCFDTQERQKLYHQFHKLLHEEEPYIFLFAPFSLMAINRRYENVRIFPLGVPTRILWVPKSKQMPVPGY